MKKMKYDLGYMSVTRATSFLMRTSFVFKRTELEHMLSLLKKEKGKILDYGCNSGYFTNMIKNVSPKNEVFGADINIHALNYARKKFKYLEFFEINNEFFQNNVFDAIVISHVLEHVKDREGFMNNISKILSSNGKIIITVPQERIRGDTTSVQLLYNFFRLRFENPHVVNLGYADLKNLLDKTGFKINEKIYINYLPPLKLNSRKFYSFSLIVSASKN